MDGAHPVAHMEQLRSKWNALYRMGLEGEHRLSMAFDTVSYFHTTQSAKQSL